MLFMTTIRSGYITNLTIFTVNNNYYIVSFMIYSDLNLVMNRIRILNNNEISFSFRLIYFMTYTA